MEAVRTVRISLSFSTSDVLPGAVLGIAATAKDAVSSSTAEAVP